MNRQIANPLHPAILVIAILNIGLHLYAAEKLEYHRDEMLYFALGYHPDWGYASVPPLIGWLAAGIRLVFGTSVLAVKLLPALLSGALIILLAAIVRELKGGNYAAILAGCGVVFMPAMLRIFHLYQPVHLDLLWWALLGYLTLRYVNTDQRKYLLYLGVALGFALLTKYLIVIYVGGLLLGLAVYRPAIYKEPYCYYGGLLALAIFLPNLIWQVANDFPVFGHMSALSANQLVHVDRASFLVDQLLMAAAGSLLILPGLVYVFKKAGYLGVATLFTFLVLLVLRGKSYYSIGMFPVLAASGAVWWENILQRKALRIALPVVIVLLDLPLLPMGIPVYGEERLIAYFADLEKDYDITPGRTFEDGTIHSLPQDYADQVGWTELAQKAATAYAREPQPEKVMIYCENYGQASALLLLNGRQGMPEPVSFSDAYNGWAPRQFDTPIEVLYYINDEQGEDVTELFEQVEVVGEITDEHAREYGAKIYRFSEPRRPFADFWGEVLARDPSPY